ncbi:Spc7 kinetochore protein-domain-containing protein [Umbelopsis sp. PMI_123]|nr:Spc7 kinetochore protein-domain-containing protein [Umbelopsis sp. PMI_123]
MSFPTPIHQKPMGAPSSEISRRSLSEAELKRRRLNSPARGILKAFPASSPFRDFDRNIHANAFTSPIRLPEDDFDITTDSTRERKLGSRRVSFAPSAHVRLFQEADRQAASKGEERKSSDLQSKLMKAAMEENHSESAGSSVTSWDVDLSRGGSAEFRRDSLSRSPFHDRNSMQPSHDNFNDLTEGNDDVTMEITGKLTSPAAHQQKRFIFSPASSRQSWNASANAQSGQYDDDGGTETMELTGTVRSSGTNTSHSHNHPNFSPFRNTPTKNRFSPGNSWPASHSTPQKAFSTGVGVFNNTSSPSPWGTSKRQSPSVSKNRYHNEASIDDSLGSDFGDRMDSFHKRGTTGNILDEEIPALDDSFTASEIPVLENMSLDEFLSYAGISFMDNITPNTTVPNLTSFDKENDPPPTLADYIITHSSTIPELELYQYCCKELTTLMEEGKVSIKESEDQIQKSTPAFISDYLTDDIDMRELMDIRFKLIKQHARLSGKQEWYLWRQNLVGEINQVLKRNLTKLEEEQEKVDRSLMKVNKRLPSLTSFLIDMRQTYIKATERAAALHTVDEEQLAELETEIEEQKSSLDTFKKDAEALKEEEAALNKQFEELLRRKQQLTEEIDHANETCNEYKCLTLDDLRVAKQHYEECVDICRWEPIKVSPDLLVFVYDRDLEIRIDPHKLKARKPDATIVRLASGENGIITEKMLPGLRDITQNNWDTSVIIQNAALYWRQVKIIKSELENMQSAYSVHFNSLQDSSGVECVVTLFNFAAKFKFTTSFPIRPEEVIDFPQVNADDWKVKRIYGDISQEDMELLVRKHIHSNGLLQLRKSFESVVKAAKLIIDQKA